MGYYGAMLAGFIDEVSTMRATSVDASCLNVRITGGVDPRTDNQTALRAEASARGPFAIIHWPEEG